MSSPSEDPITTEPPHILAANAGDNVSALAMAPLPKGSGSHAEAAVNHQALAAANQQAANNISGGGKKTRGRKIRGGRARRTRRRSTRRGKLSSKKRRSKKHQTKRKSRGSRRYPKRKK